MRGHRSAGLAGVAGIKRVENTLVLAGVGFEPLR